MTKSTIGDKITETETNPHPFPLPLHSKLGSLLFSIGSSNSGTTLHGGDGGGKALEGSKA